MANKNSEQTARTLAAENGLRYVDLARTVFSPGAASLLSEATARRFQAVPIERRRGVTVVALADPTDTAAMDALRGEIEGEFATVVARSDHVSTSLTRLYGSGPIRTRVPPEDQADPLRSVADGDADAPGPRQTFVGSHDLLNGALFSPSDAAAGEVRWTTPSDGPPAAPGDNGSVATQETTQGQDEDASPLEAALREVLAAPTVGDSATPPAPTVGRDQEDAEPARTLESGWTAALEEIPRPAGAEVADDPGTGVTVEDGTGTGTPPPPTAAAESAPAPPTGPVTDGGAPVEATTPEPAAGTAETGPAFDPGWPPLARVLVSQGRVAHAAMADAMVAHKEAGESLARYLFNNKLATEEDLVRAMAEEIGLEFVDLATLPVDPGAAAMIPDSVARRHMVLPIRIENGVPLVAMANPTDVFAMDDLRSIMGRHFTPVVATRSAIASHLRYAQETDSDVEQAAESAADIVGGGAAGGFEIESIQSVVEDAPIVRYVNLLILQALNERASDIHIEPTPRRMRIRFRIDGVMHDASSASPAIHPAVVSRLKVLGEMDITEHRLPQEGRVSVSVGNRQIDLRMATLPSLYGETCVMRLLDKTASIRQLAELGFFPDTLDRYSATYHQPYGVILVTGPTGAGKTTTLYATLQEVLSRERSVVTVEDPVEYQIDGITQVQINTKAGLKFSTALRSILRADPDIVLIGEVRDLETATIAMEAALSGHLVLTTLHTNTAASTPLRLTEMGVEPFLVTSAVSSVLTQRLARVLCERCKEPYDASLADFYAAGYREVDLEGMDTTTLYRAAGCRTCSHTGYYGRMVLAEVMPISEEIERMIIEGQSIVAIEREAIEQGMRTLRQDGLRKAIAGFTTLEEVLRVVV